jgi:Centromere DNA-binding protein complex CBF3 subunit, domain 2
MHCNNLHACAVQNNCILCFVVCKAGRATSAWLARHANPLLCAVGSLALWLLFWFDFSEDDRPNFKQQAEWYRFCSGFVCLGFMDIHDYVVHRVNLYLFHGERPDRQMSYKSHWKVISTMFQKVGIVSAKTTHLARGNAARDTKDAGYVSLR